jgi:transposase InsO family protein
VDESNNNGRTKDLVRYEVISGYLALEPKRGQRGELLNRLAGKVWTGVDGEPFQVAAETIRKWVARYRDKGLAGLADKPRPIRGTLALTPEQIELACRLKREVPERSLDRLIRIMEQMKLVEPGAVRRSTLHRALQQEDLSARPSKVAGGHDLDRFEASAPNDLWQSDMLTGPWLPDPLRPGKVRRAYLYAFLDDHARMLLHGRFSFKGDLPALELVFRRCLQKYGVCRRAYYDNAAVYRARHMKQIVAELGIHPIIYTTRYRPMGHGKIEALNRQINSAFIAELKASRISSLDTLNEAFCAWCDLEYNRKVHSETGEPPLERWRKGIDRVRYADEEKLRQAFLWKEDRTPDKSGLFSLFATRYQVGPGLARKRIQVRYDPQALDEVEAWHQGAFKERVRPFEVRTHRRPKAKTVEKETPKDPASSEPTADWLTHLVSERRHQRFDEPSPRQLTQQALAQRQAQDQAIIDLLVEQLDPAVVDIAAITDFLKRYGPFDSDRAQAILERLLAHHPHDQHVLFYLDAIREALDTREAP